MPFIPFVGNVNGPSHARKGGLCEDSYAIRPCGDWVSAVVCDGCGSVAHAREGAIFISDFVAGRLAAFAPIISDRGLGEWVYGPIVEIFAELRDEMRIRFAETIGDYAATIVAALISYKNGILIHIGDGIATSFAMAPSESGLSLSSQAQSCPENGEYINETYYVTDNDWLKHLRILPIAQSDCVMLCSDGAQALFYEGNKPSERALKSLMHELQAAQDKASNKLDELLQRPEATKLSDDDKTVVLLVSRDGLTKVGISPPSSVLSGVPPEPAAEPSPPQPTSPEADAPAAAQRIAALEAELAGANTTFERLRQRSRKRWLAGTLVGAVVLGLFGYGEFLLISKMLQNCVASRPASVQPSPPSAPQNSEPPACGTQSLPQCPTN
jgi:Protein phosphatase 2C